MAKTERTPVQHAPWLVRISVGLLLMLFAGGIGAGSIAIGLAAAPLLVARIAGSDPAPAMLATIYTFAVFAPIAIAAMVAARLVPGAGIVAGHKPIGWMLTGLAIGASGLVLSASLAGFAGTIGQGPAPSGAVIVLLAGAVVTILQAGAEELLLRGFLQPVLVQYWGQWAAVIGASLLFTALHLAGQPRGPIEIVNLFLAGVLFGMLALRTGGIIAPIAAHWAWNCAETLVLGLSPNPGVSEFGALIDLDMRGAALWGGSPAGLNGSVAVSLVLIALTLPLLLWRPVPIAPATASAPATPVAAPSTLTSPPALDARSAWFLGGDDGSAGH